ncbi:hypothetical protein [Nocardia sp. SC052]|uniref:hypothetical protein n=1 Tax=Nocardia sichangensis TaxID=3385975 RepID=UPI0039A01A09
MTAWVQPAYGRYQRPEIAVVPADETGASAERTLQRRPGSFVLHDEPDSTERIEGAYWMALQMLGGYTIVEPEPQPEPEPDPDPGQP